MQSSKSKQHPAPTVASSDDYLPGLAPLECDAESPGYEPDTTNRSGSWVRRSAKQVTDAAGLPVGYRHQLMHGRVVVRTGIGSDYARTFREQADFLNSRCAQAIHQATTSSAEGPSTPASSPH